ncbi:MAG: response regulator transcription factor [Kiritimatiellae bacterium]|nr:response regulator transcription factor [Kiritimatiellia bacterium]
MKVLIAEDDLHTREALIEILNDEGYETLAAADGREALKLYTQQKPDFVCLDVMMPDLSGYDVCREIRRFDRHIPIIFITAKSEEIDKVLGLEIGADDYIVKPFGVKEVVARIHAVSRRIHRSKISEGEHVTEFVMCDLKIVPCELRAYRDEQAIDLSPRDASILELLFHNRGKVIDRNTLFNECWGLNYMPDSRSLDQHISQLRKRIEKDPHDPCIIRTVHGAGYRFEG